MPRNPQFQTPAFVKPPPRMVSQYPTPKPKAKQRAKPPPLPSTANRPSLSRPDPPTLATYPSPHSIEAGMEQTYQTPSEAIATDENHPKHQRSGSEGSAYTDAELSEES